MDSVAETFNCVVFRYRVRDPWTFSKDRLPSCLPPKTGFSLTANDPGDSNPPFLNPNRQKWDRHINSLLKRLVLCMALCLLLHVQKPVSFAKLLRKPCLCFYARDRKFIFKYLLYFLLQGENESPFWVILFCFWCLCVCVCKKLKTRYFVA